jgi:hypothetical protein
MKQARLDDVGATFIAYFFIGGGVAGLVLKHFHQAGHYGFLEILYGLVFAAWFLAACLMPIVLLLVLWRWLAERKEAMNARNFIIATILAALATWWAGTGMLHILALGIWESSPLGLSYADASDNYHGLCGYSVQDDQNSGHWEKDWSRNFAVCRSLSGELNAAYPEPAWLFGTRPLAESD